MSASATVGEEFAPEARNANQFSLYNQLNFQITLGAPMILYAKSLGAGATTIGIVAALAPLLTVLQLPTAYFIPKVGYKRFVLLGWLSRTIIGFSLALLPLVTALDAATKTSLMLMCLFTFNVLRGISTGAWLPWLTSLIPETSRGAFLRRDQTFMQIGGVLAMALSTLVLWRDAHPGNFSFLFLLSACAGTLSLFFIRRIPDVSIEDQIRGSGQPVPWLEILRHPPFSKLLIFNVVYNWVVGGLAAFAIGFLQSRARFTDGAILACSLLSFVGASVSVSSFGELLNQVGSKPILRIAIVCYLWAVICWVLLSSNLLYSSASIVAIIYFILGIAGGLFSIANTRMAMDTMPVMGRNHFFSLFTVFSSLSLGLAPIGWGIFLDLLANLEARIGAFEINRYSIYFSLLVVLVIVTFILANPLVEKKGQPFSLALRDTVIYSRLRLFSRFLNR
jgi:MFS family permease